MQVLVALYTIGSFRWETLMLAAVSFPIYGRALLNAIFRRDTKWHVTGGVHKKASPFNFITQQIMAFVFLLITSVVGIWQAVTVSSWTLALAWNLLNTFVLGLFMVTATREARRIRQGNRALAASARLHASRSAAPRRQRPAPIEHVPHPTPVAAGPATFRPDTAGAVAVKEK
jgi:cellulose synthase (UDP-forming)